MWVLGIYHHAVVARWQVGEEILPINAAAGSGAGFFDELIAIPIVIVHIQPDRDVIKPWL